MINFAGDRHMPVTNPFDNGLPNEKNFNYVTADALCGNSISGRN